MDNCYFITSKTKVIVNQTLICMQLPLKTLSLIWKTQVFFLTLPSRCVRKCIGIVCRLVGYLNGGRADPKIEDILTKFLGEEKADKEKLLSSFREVLKHSLTALAKLDGLNNNFLQCRRDICAWKGNGEKKSDDVPVEKKLYKDFWSSLRNMDLQDADAKFSNFGERTKFVHKGVSTCDFSDISLPSDINSILKVVYTRLVKQLEELRESFNGRCEESLLLSKEQCVPTLGKKDTKGMVFVSVGAETMKTMIGFLNEENATLTKYLKYANEELKNSQISNKALKERVALLEKMLRRAKKKIRSAEDNLSTRLLILSDLIEEQEEFLNKRDHIQGLNSTSPTQSINESHYDTADDIEPSGSQRSSPWDL